MIIDTHSHYNLPPLKDDWKTHWQEAQRHSVTGSVVVGTSVETSQKAVELAILEPRFFAAVGIHPNEPVYSASNNFSTSAWDEQLRLISNMVPSEKVIAIGEAGLDYFRLPETIETSQVKSLQRYILTAQIELAAQHHLPLIVHLRDRSEAAYWDFLEIIKAVPQRPQVFILHCVSGPLDYIRQCIELGAFVGVAGNSTYKNADQLHAIIKTVPMDRIVLETDAPFLPPVPHRGKTCEPWMIELTATFLKEEYNLDLDKIIENTYQVFPSFKALI